MVVSSKESSDYPIPGIHTTDMAIDSEGIICLTGQAPIDNESIGCHLTKINPATDECITEYSKGKTKIYGAKLNNPGLSIDSDGNIYLATFYCKSVEVYTRKGKFSYQIDLTSTANDNPLPIDVVAGKEYIYIVASANNCITIYKKVFI